MAVFSKSIQIFWNALDQELNLATQVYFLQQQTLHHTHLHYNICYHKADSTKFCQTSKK